MLYAIAFAQGREISLWPPKIGPNPNASKQYGKKIASSNVKSPMLGTVKTTVNADEKLLKKSVQAASNRKVTEKDISSLLRKHNDDFCKVIDTRDNRYLKATATDKAVAKGRQDIINLLDYMQENNIKITRLTEMSLVSWQFISDNKIEATTDEVWEDKYLDGHISESVNRNIYEILLLDGRWLIDASEVLPVVGKDLAEQN
jgi:hypothetical protein